MTHRMWEVLKEAVNDAYQIGNATSFFPCVCCSLVSPHISFAFHSATSIALSESTFCETALKINFNADKNVINLC